MHQIVRYYLRYIYLHNPYHTYATIFLDRARRKSLARTTLNRARKSTSKMQSPNCLHRDSGLSVASSTRAVGSSENSRGGGEQVVLYLCLLGWDRVKWSAKIWGASVSPKYIKQERRAVQQEKNQHSKSFWQFEEISMIGSFRAQGISMNLGKILCITHDGSQRPNTSEGNCSVIYLSS